MKLFKKCRIFNFIEETNPEYQTGFIIVWKVIEEERKRK